MLCCRDLLLLYTSYLTLCLIGIHCAALMLIDIWWCLLILPPFLQDSSTYTHSLHTMKVNLIQMFLSYQKTFWDIQASGGYISFFATDVLPRIYFHILGKRVPPLYCVQYFAKYFLVLEIFQPTRLPGHFSSLRFHSFLCPSLRFLIRLSTYIFFSLVISYCVTVKWISPFSH